MIDFTKLLFVIHVPVYAHADGFYLVRDEDLASNRLFEEFVKSGSVWTRDDALQGYAAPRTILPLPELS